MSEGKASYGEGEPARAKVWTLEEFAEHVRAECNRIMGAGLVGNGRLAAEVAAELCQLAADIKLGRTGPLVEPADYDLAALVVEGGPMGAGE